MRLTLTFVLLMPLLAACGDGPARPQENAAPPSAAALPAGNAVYAIAGDTPLEAKEPQNWDDLHNVFELSDSIISGSEPYGEEAIRRIAAMGVKTIVSVDGKVPDQETAAKYGMRYVHVPIQYKGITQEERLRLAKTFRELDGPFFVHCFHGKHRGPAAAALGRLVRDGAAREQAVAEMRQYCGTSARYEGLYETIGRGAVPTAEQTDVLAWEFPAAHSFDGFRGVMIALTRAHDHLKLSAKTGFQPAPDHPDLNARNEAARLAELYATALALEETDGRPEDYRIWLEESASHARALVEHLGELQPEGGAGALTHALDELTAVTQRCDTCHKAYRNH